MGEEKILHITNGDGLTDKLQKLAIPGDVIVWREMLNEGPAVQEVGTEEFINLRKKFLLENYQVSDSEYDEKFIGELEKLATIKNYDEIVLWFEFDLFSHMNMLALISFFMQHKKSSPLFLVCSGKLKGERELVPLSELTINRLQRHYDYKIALTLEDRETATLIWEIYCDKDPLRLSSEIKKTTNFEYLSSCLRAHIERFPHAKTGLNSLETNVLQLIKEHPITSLHHLLGYALQYQGYYGYVDIQMNKVIKKLEPFYSEDKNGITLNEAGIQALDKKKNFYQQLKDNEYYGGARKYAFLYDPETHHLLKL